MSFELTDNIKKAIAKDVPLHDIVHGEVLNDLIVSQGLELGDDEVTYNQGYMDALQAVYGFIYALVFEQADQKREQENPRKHLRLVVEADQKKEVAHGN
jgi:hypothetical protein